VIGLAVRWYLRYGLPYRDVEELLAERGIEVDHVTIFLWVRRCVIRPILKITREESSRNRSLRR
jgi:transposase-like protein